MGDKYFPLGKLHNVFGYFVELGRFPHHVIGNTGKLRNKKRNGPLRINEGIVLIDYLVAIVNKYGNFGNPVLGWLSAGSFDIYDSVQMGYV